MQDFEPSLIRQKLKDGSFTISDIECILSMLEKENATEFFEMFEQYMLLNKREDRASLTEPEMEQIVHQILKADH